MSCVFPISPWSSRCRRHRRTAPSQQNPRFAQRKQIIYVYNEYVRRMGQLRSKRARTRVCAELLVSDYGTCSAQYAKATTRRRQRRRCRHNIVILHARQQRRRRRRRECSAGYLIASVHAVASSCSCCDVRRLLAVLSMCDKLYDYVPPRNGCANVMTYFSSVVGLD